MISGCCSCCAVPAGPGSAATGTHAWPRHAVTKLCLLTTLCHHVGCTNHIEQTPMHDGSRWTPHLKRRSSSCMLIAVHYGYGLRGDADDTLPRGICTSCRLAHWRWRDAPADPKVSWRAAAWMPQPCDSGDCRLCPISWAMARHVCGCENYNTLSLRNKRS